MAKLDSLIKVRKHTVEEKQKFLAELFREEEALLEEKAQNLEALQKEAELAETNEDIHLQQSFYSFREAVKQKIQAIDDAIQKLEIRIEIAQDAMREAYGELKKVEIVDRNRKAEEKRAALKRENDHLNEIGIQIFSKET